MLHFENKLFERIYDRDSGKVFCNAEFHKCRFLSCALSVTFDPKLRSIIKDVRLTDCEQRGCSLWPAVVQDVLVDGLKTNGLFQTWAAVFQRVTLKGKIERVMMSRLVAPGKATREQQMAFDAANDFVYSRVDWALDIRQALFEECEIQGVPAPLIRRDPRTQVVVTRAKAMKGLWRKLDLSGTHWAKSLELFLKRGDPDVVLVAPKLHKKFDLLLHGLMLLREAGVADGD